jgi:DNA-binding GntR family transcriptional regulator
MCATEHASRHTTRRALGALSEETLEGTITGASAIVIDSTSTDDERTEAINGFAEDIRNMSGE